MLLYVLSAYCKLLFFCYVKLNSVSRTVPGLTLCWKNNYFLFILGELPVFRPQKTPQKGLEDVTSIFCLLQSASCCGFRERLLSNLTNVNAAKPQTNNNNKQ